MRASITSDTKRSSAWIQWYWVALLGACGGISVLQAADTNAPAATPPPMTPEQFFEGGTNTYKNWIELGAGGFITSGNKAQAEQNQQSWNGPFGGIEDFHLGTSLGQNTTLAADGHALFDNRDYQLKLDLENQNIGFVRLNYDYFRTWENGAGGFYPPTGAWYPQSDDALALDNGTISFESGLRLQNSPYMPKITFKYTHTYRNGEEPSTSWGDVQPAPNTARGLTPSFYAIDEHRDIFQLDAAEHIQNTDFGAGLRYEIGDLNDSLKSDQWPGQSYNQSATDQSSVSYGLFNGHAYSETWLKDNLMFSVAYSYSQLNNDFTGSYTYQPDLGVLNGFSYNQLTGNSWVRDHVVNLNLYTKLMKNLSIVPSLRIQKEDTKVNGSEDESFQGISAMPPDGHGSQSDLEVSERLDLTYTGITNWVLYARGEWSEGDGNLNQNGGLIPINGNSEFQSVQSRIDNNRLFQKYSAGVRWYPLYRVSLDVGGYYKKHHYDYSFPIDSTANNNPASYDYPGFLAMQNFETFDGNTRLTLRPWQSVSFIGRYEYQYSKIYTGPDPISGLGESESMRMYSHIISVDANWSPWSRLSLTAGFDYVLSTTKTPVSDYVPYGVSAAPILAAQNNYWMVNFSSDFIVDDKTDLKVGYYYYQAHNYDNNATVGVPYGTGAEEHAITAQIVRRITENLRLKLNSGYYHYTDDTSGGHNDFDTLLVFASMQYRF